MKTLHITQPYGDGGGGAALTVDSLCTLLERAGHENAVLYGWQTGPLPTASRKTLYLKQISSYHFKPDMAGLAIAKAFVARENPDLIQFHDCENFELMSFLARRYSSVLYIYNHALTCPSGTRFYAANHQFCSLSTGPACITNRYLKRCGSRKPAIIWKSYQRSLQLAEIAKLVSKIVVISKYMKQTLIEAGHSAEAISVIPSLSPSLVNDFETAPTSPLGNLLLFAGRITEIKGLEVLLRCLPHLKNPWKLMVAGEGYRLPEALRLVKELGLQDRVEFKGWLPNREMAALYRQAALVVVPSLYPDPFVLCGIEAMCYARPVIAFNVGGIPDWLSNGYNGFLCSPGNIPEMAARIDQLLSDPVLAAQMGLNGKHKLLTEFHPNAITTAFEQIYREATHGYSVTS